MSTNDERKTIEELIALYELEPDIRDIYVEGYSDKTVVEWFLKTKEIKNVAVYDIGTVNVPFDLIQDSDLEDNNRGRVITLALVLQKEITGDPFNLVACIADKDFDELLGIKHDCSILLFTDYAAMEIYLLNERVVDKFLNLVITGFPQDAHTIFDNIIPALEEIFLIRLANQILKFGIGLIPIEKCCAIALKGFNFDFDEFIKRYLNKGGKYAEKDIFIRTVNAYRRNGRSDPRLRIHGHDFTYLLNKYINKIKKPKTHQDLDSFVRAFFGTLEISDIDNTNLFKELTKRFS
jgi:hypothetical protein